MARQLLSQKKLIPWKKHIFVADCGTCTLQVESSPYLSELCRNNETTQLGSPGNPSTGSPSDKPIHRL